MGQFLQVVRVLVAPLFLASCAVGPGFETADAEVGLTPAEAVRESEALRGTTVIWGGVIIGATNLPETTRLEVLAYPLDGNQRPNTAAEPWGRFLSIETGYLETVDYGPGRAVTVRGRLDEPQPGRIGRAPYVYPVVEAENIYLWPEAGPPSPARFHFGIGVIFSN